MLYDDASHASTALLASTAQLWPFRTLPEISRQCAPVAYAVLEATLLKIVASAILSDWPGMPQMNNLLTVTDPLSTVDPKAIQRVEKC